MIHTRDDISILVTDSGLGGLDVAARLVRHAKAQRLGRRLRVTFVNCKPSAEVGYHDLDASRRPAVFSRAMQAMAQQFEPDVMLVACNTLSAIYHETDFCRGATVPVHGIIAAGCELIGDYLSRQPRGRVLAFATPMTCASGAHGRMLDAAGFDRNRLIVQPCPGLAGAIDREPDSPEVHAKIEEAVDGALRQVAAGDDAIAAALFCTHFGYVAELFAGAFAERGRAIAAMLNPNQRMAEQCLTGMSVEAQPPAVEVQVVTQSPHSEQAKQAIGRLIARIDAQTAAALQADVCRVMFDVAQASCL